MTTKNAEYMKQKRQELKDAGFKHSLVALAPGTHSKVQKYAYRIAKEAGLTKP